MDASDLKIFEAVARIGNITKASTVLNTVQSNVTARIRSLEDELGIALLHRHARGVVPTIAGQKLLPYARRIVQLLAEAKSAVTEEPAVPQGALSFGTLETTAAIRLPPVLTRYKADFPNVELAIRTGTTQELVEDVLQYKIEGAFVAGPVRHPDLAEEAMFPEELVLIGARSRSPLQVLEGNRTVELMVLRRGCSYRSLLENFLIDHGIQNYRIMELGTIEAILGLVAAGMGISLLPKVVVSTALNRNRISLETLPTARSIVETVFVRRRDGLYSNSAKCLVEYMRAAHGPETSSTTVEADLRRRDATPPSETASRVPIKPALAPAAGRVVD
jgi:LysR family transcriptional regulator, cell division regulator